ncbi:MAG: hydrogenase maturation nickel metallochaperone HypA [Bacteroidales bacterium]|jgi:hydrogenase nickel incorporation protein HypA/HybF|nr:hydrogenase maturation nickel metallochaperone HypA [Bacteroidales bacterium]MDD4213560.1 hydrogenase maturation nickel metallochaperone HypA [Bacteroidales bacterium]
MHELSIATSIIEFAEEFATEHKTEKIKRIELEVGQLSGVVTESLKFALELAVKDTVLESTEIIINEVTGKSICNNCNKEFENPDWYTPCPACQSIDSEIVSGKELHIKSIITG